MDTERTCTIDLIWGLWEWCLLTARAADLAAADGVQQLIRQTRTIIWEDGLSRDDSDYILFDIYTRIHWDWQEPTDRVFEGLLEFELEDYFNKHFKVKAN